jgi:hypothetical protein
VTRTTHDRRAHQWWERRRSGLGLGQGRVGPTGGEVEGEEVVITEMSPQCCRLFSWKGLNRTTNPATVALNDGITTTTARGLARDEGRRKGEGKMWAERVREKVEDNANESL